MHLVDTNVVSEARRGSPEAAKWLRSVDPAGVYLSVITLGEIMRGIALRQKLPAYMVPARFEISEELPRFNPSSCTAR